MRKNKYVLYLVSILLISIGCTQALPELPKESLQGASEIISTNPEVEDAEIIVEGDLLKFYILPSEEQESLQERFRKLGEDYLRLLGGYIATDELTGPTDEFYGGIYEFYDVEIIIEGYRGAVLDRGTKAKGQNQIQWQ